LFGIGENVLREQLRKKKEISLEDLPDIPDYVGKYVTTFEINERNRAIRDLVDSTDKPCAPLLLKFYWEGYSMDEIAIQLGYANANSAKTQKNKCMNKLKALFKAS
jgi:DNA-directed RNA polymerase specialized sigma24 family protein